MVKDQKIIKARVGLLELARQLGNVSEACKIMGYSRDTFYRYKELFDQGGEHALKDVSKSKPILKNRVDPAIEEAVCELAIENPALGQVRVSNELKKRALYVSPGGVRTIWLRHDLETMKKRLKALEAKVAQDGGVLTEAQLAALEKANQQKEAHGEIETEHPGYWGSQDTFLCGYSQRCGTCLSTDVHRHLLQGRLRQAVHTKACHYRGRLAQRPSLPFLRRKWDSASTNSYRSWYGVLR